MVVLNPTTTSGVSANSGGLSAPTTTTTTSPSNSYLSPYLQPLPSDLDPKVSPLAMLTRACNQIESKLMMDSATKKNGLGSLSLDKSLSPSSSSSSSSGSPKSPPVSRKSPMESFPKAVVPSGPLSTSSSVSAPLSCPTPPSSKERSSTASPPKNGGRNPSPFPPPPTGLYPFGFPGLFPPPPASPCTDPLCRDPSCPTTIWRNSQLLQRSYMFPYGLPPPAPHHLFPPSSVPPFTCNWMQGTDFCGRRFSSSEELMSHLRSHTNGESSPDATLAALQSAQLNALSAASQTNGTSALAALQAQAAQMCQKISLSSSSPTTSTTPSKSKSSPKVSESSSSSSRYHPYSRASFPSSALPPLPPHLMGLPPSMYMPPSPYAAAAAMAAAAAAGLAPYPI